MKRTEKKEFGTVGYSLELNVFEMETIIEMCAELDYILMTHKTPSQKKKYLNDDQLIKLFAILTRISKDLKVQNNNDFEEETMRIVDWYKSNTNVDAPVERPAIPSLFPEQGNDDMEAIHE